MPTSIPALTAMAESLVKLSVADEHSEKTSFLGKAMATLGSKVVVAGIHNRVELWNEDEWNKYTSGVEKQANDLAQKLSDIGMI